MYATPRRVERVEDCLIYHTIDLPGETIRGQWDLRDSVDDYLGRVDVRGKRVLDIGTAGGFLTFSLERLGAAEVVSFDMASGGQWDIVPYHHPDFDVDERRRAVLIEAERVKAGYWYAHERLGSKARVYYGDYRCLPAELGTFDVVVVGMILPHVSDPFALLTSAATLASSTLIVTQQAEQIISAYARWMPQAATCLPDRAWWSLSEGCISAMLAVVGFEVERVTKRGYRRAFEDRDEDCTTFVARRRLADEPPSGTVMLSRAGTSGVRWPADHQDRVLAGQSAAVEQMRAAVEEGRAQTARMVDELERAHAEIERLTHAVEGARGEAHRAREALATSSERLADERRASAALHDERARAYAGLAENAANLRSALASLDEARAAHRATRAHLDATQAEADLLRGVAGERLALIDRQAEAIGRLTAEVASWRASWPGRVARAWWRLRRRR